MYGAITHYGQTFQTVPLFTHQSAGPRSLVATRGVSVDFLSSRYLDISVPWVRFLTLYIQVRMTTNVAGFPHSDIPGSKLVYQLPEAFRRFPRPSSPSTAKASTVCA